MLFYSNKSNGLWISCRCVAASFSIWYHYNTAEQCRSECEWWINWFNYGATMKTKTNAEHNMKSSKKQKKNDTAESVSPT